MKGTAERPAERSELRAYDELMALERATDVVALARAILLPASDERRVAWREKSLLEAEIKRLELPDGAAETPSGDARLVLERGPEDDAERALACALAAAALSSPDGREADRTAARLLWLAAHTPFDATMLIDRAQGERAGELWSAIGHRIKRFDDGRLPSVSRGEMALACAAIAASTSKNAQTARAALELSDPLLARIVSEGAAATEEARLDGELVAAPRNVVLTVFLAVTGLLLVMAVVRAFARLALSYRRPAELSVSPKGIRIKTRTELLGRTIREREIHIGKDALVRAVREVRFPRLGLYAGLLALVLGSYIGVGALVDGVRAASPSLLGTGLLVVAAGIGLDVLFSSVGPGARGRCRVSFLPKRGGIVCVGFVDAARADSVLLRLR